MRRSPRLAKENLFDSDTYEKSDVATKKSTDLLLKKLFLQNGLFTYCEHAEFGVDTYDGILVTTTTGHNFCMSGPLLRDISDPDYIIAYLTEERITWTE